MLHRTARRFSPSSATAVFARLAASFHSGTALHNCSHHQHQGHSCPSCTRSFHSSAATRFPNRRWRCSNGESVMEYFPKMYDEEKFVHHTYKHLAKLGFTNNNSLPCVSVCRDELCTPLMKHIDETWRSDTNKGGVSFIMSSLAGMVVLGRTGIAAASAHAPIDQNGVERLIFYAFPHIGISPSGEVGKSLRPGMPSESTACGALVALHGQLSSGQMNIELDNNDMEISILRQKLLKKLRISDAVPGLMKITRLIQEANLADLQTLVKNLVQDNPKRKIQYAIVSGVQVHAPDLKNYIWPQSFHAVIDGKQVDLPLDMSDDSAAYKEDPTIAFRTVIQSTTGKSS